MEAERYLSFIQWGTSRRLFLKGAGLAAAGVAAATGLGPGFWGGYSAVLAADSDGDIVTFAYLLEQVAIKAYNAAAGTGLLQPPVLAVATKFRDQHQQHADALGSALKTRNLPLPQAPASLNLPALKSQNDILSFAEVLEDVAVGAYFGSITAIQDKALGQAAASIMGVESQHVAVLRAALGKDPIPTAFVTGRSASEIQQIVAQVTGTMPSGSPRTGAGGAADA